MEKWRSEHPYANFDVAHKVPQSDTCAVCRHMNEGGIIYTTRTVEKGEEFILWEEEDVRVLIVVFVELVALLVVAICTLPLLVLNLGRNRP